MHIHDEGTSSMLLRIASAAMVALTLLLPCGLVAQSTRQIVPSQAPSWQKNARPQMASQTRPPGTLQILPGEWNAMQGAAVSIGANARGQVWVIADGPRQSQEIYCQRGRVWEPVRGATGVHIAVDMSGNAWVVQANGGILHYTGTQWERIPGEAIDIAVGANGAIWIIGPDRSIQRAFLGGERPFVESQSMRGERALRGSRQEPTEKILLQYRWERIPGVASRIAVDPQGNPWVVNAAGKVAHYNGAAWTEFSQAARDIAVGPDGVVYVVGTIPTPDGFPILRSHGSEWVSDGIAGQSIAAGPAGVAYAIKGTRLPGAIVERAPSVTTAGIPPVFPGAPATITAASALQTTAAPTPQQVPPAPTHTNIRGIAGTQTTAQPSSGTSGGHATPSSTTTAQGATQTTSGQVPIPLTSATIHISPAASPGSLSITAPSQPIVINPPTITKVSPQSSTNQGTVVIPTAAAEPTIQQPSNLVVAPMGTIKLNQPGAITLNQVAGSTLVNPVKAPGAPTGASGSLVTTGSLVIPGSSPSNPVRSSPSAAPLQVTGLGYAPINAPVGSHTLITGDPYVYTPGKLLCSDPEVMNICGNVDAGFVGGYTLNTVCKNGFYDLTNGGTCWQCPNDDGHGSWLRSADPVTTGTACWRDATSSAHWDGYGMSWNCSSGQFWDSQDQNHNVNGSCWDCPPLSYNGDSLSTNRTANPVWSNAACSVHQTSPAAMLGYNGCPQPDKSKMYPGNDKRRAGEPFLDIASGLSVAGNAGGACWACPVTDEQGNYLYTERNGNTLIGRKTGNGGCSVRFKYTPGVFVEPGLSGLPGVADVLAQEQVFQRPAALTTFLYGLASAKNFSGAAADTWVAAQWQDIAAHPYQNAQIKALMYEYMTGGAPPFMYASGVVGTGTTDEQAAQTKLVNSFQEYIRARRTYVAQEALDMYYAWKANVGVERSLHAESELQTLFYYGTVPLDFQSIVAAALVPSVTGAAVLGSIVTAENYADIAIAHGNSWVSTTTNAGKNIVSRQFGVDNLLRDMFKPAPAPDAVEAPGPEVNISSEFAFEPTPELGAEIATEAGGEMAGEAGAEAAAEAGAMLMAQIDLATGPAGIVLAGVTMAAIAIQQVVEIANAEPNLIKAKNSAMNNVSLSWLLQQPTGPDQAAQYWSDATGVTTEAGTPQINTAAANAYTLAQQSHFARIQAASNSVTNAAGTTNRQSNPLHRQ